jgi:hypothetical protein
MRLTPPKNVTFLIAVVLFVLGLLGTFGKVAMLASYNPWLFIAAFVVLALGVMLKDL